jgi:hypothetical protein
MYVAEAIEAFVFFIIISAVAVEISGILAHDDIANQTLHIFAEAFIVIGHIGIQDMNDGLVFLRRNAT